MVAAVPSGGGFVCDSICSFGIMSISLRFFCSVPHGRVAQLVLRFVCKISQALKKMILAKEGRACFGPTVTFFGEINKDSLQKMMRLVTETSMVTLGYSTLSTH